MLVYERARREADQLLEAHWDGTFPVALGSITRSLNGDVTIEQLATGLSGFIVKSENDDVAHIVLNRDEVAERQRFTWAHELGHLVERRSVAGDEDFSFVDTRAPSTYDLHEFFADEFAGALLMPRAELKRVQEQGWSLLRMADHFGVSVPALRKRLARLAKQPDE